MSEVILKEKQLKKALRNKKGNKQTVKNVLSAPEELSWPILKGNDLNVLKEALESCLPQINPGKVSIKYDEIKSIKKEERKEYRLQKTVIIGSENKDKNDKIDKECLIFGLNQVNRLVLNGSAGFVLISSTVNPRFILEGLIRDCTFYKVPYLLLPDLKDVLLKRCGIKSMIIAFKKSTQNSTNLELLRKVFGDVYRKFGWDDLNSQKLEEIEIKTRKGIESIEEIKKQIKNEEENVKETVKEEEFKINFNPDVVYLKRNDKTKRVFQPNSSNLIENKKKAVVKNDFIGFGDCNIVGDTIKYKPLIVKRVKSDSDRNKKKIKSK